MFNAKKAQITIFVILGIIILAVVILALSLQKKDTTADEIIDQSFSSSVVDNVNSYNSQCFDQVIRQSIRETLMKGGYYELTDINHEIIEKFQIPYYLKNNQIKIPAEEEVLVAISKKISEDFDACTDNYEAFKNQDMEIKKEETITRIGVEDGGLNIEISPETTLIIRETKHYLRKMSDFVFFNLTNLLEATEKITLNQKDFRTGYVDASSYQAIAHEHDILFNVLAFDENNVLVVLSTEEEIMPSLFFLLET